MFVVGVIVVGIDVVDVIIIIVFVVSMRCFCFGINFSVIVERPWSFQRKIT